MSYTQTPSPNFNERKTVLRYIVLHYTGMENGEMALERMCDPSAQVSTHYMIEEDGRVFQLVDEDKRAWHAGVSCWQGERDMNSASIGIEIVNGGHDFGLPEFPAVQIEAVIELVKSVMERHGIKAKDVIGHSDIAPGRKQDPGEKFPWDQLARAGCVIAAPEPTNDALSGDIEQALIQIGYSLEPGLDAVIEAFQRRYRPDGILGRLDAQTKKMILDCASSA